MMLLVWLLSKHCVLLVNEKDIEDHWGVFVSQFELLKFTFWNIESQISFLVKLV